MRRPIGFFDSGIGGMSLLPAVAQLLPNESIKYIADHRYAPYGNKSSKLVLSRARLITEQLIQWNCKLIVVACNTATTQIIDQLRQEYPVPFVGIEPAIKPAAATTTNGIVGILATKGTLTSELYQQSIAAYGSNISVIEQIGEGLVACVEAGAIEDETSMTLLKTHLTPLLDQNIDTLILGCTHYPFLKKSIEKLLPASITIIDNSAAIALQIKRLLEKENALAHQGLEKQQHFYSTKKENNFTLFTPEVVEYLPL
ncbi:MAG: glutamate racemase [Flavobacteriaceae bacterium]